MALKLKGSTSGFTAIDAPAVAGDNTLVLPDGNGTAHQVLKNSATAGTLEYGLALPSGNGSSGQYLQSDGAGGSSWQTVTDTGLVKTTNASTDISGATTFIMTGIDADAEEIHMYWSDFYTSNGAHFHFRFGTEESGGTIYTSGYNSHSHFSNGTTGFNYETTLVNFVGAGSGSSTRHNGQIRISKRNNFEYYFQAYTAHTNAGYWWLTQGTWEGNAALTRIQWIVATGTPTIASGTAQIATFA